jgi:hypothetical protein
MRFCARCERLDGGGFGLAKDEARERCRVADPLILPFVVEELARVAQARISVLTDGGLTLRQRAHLSFATNAHRVLAALVLAP